ncbi:MAG: sensor histidine kinase [Actinomycetota bacterium]|nr:sensor histidine kinase [Actinomycetota bacterium]
MQQLRTLGLPSPRITRAVADGLVVALVLGTFVLENPWQRDGTPAWQWAVAALLTSGLLLFRRRSPLAALVGVVALWVAVHTPQAIDDPAFQFMALLVSAYALGAHAPRREGLVGLLLAAVAFSAMNLTRGEEVEAAVAGSIQFSVMFVFGVLVGGAASRERVLRERAARLEAERDERAQIAVEDERKRIARDLHDSLGHTISAMVLQVSAVRRRLGEDQGIERESLVAVERSGRDAVTELRRMLGMLRDQPTRGLEPLPSLARVDELARTMRAAGVPVDVRVEGDPSDVPAGVDVAGYRILQEALTNVLKHAPDARATVRVAYAMDGVTLEVADDGLGAHDNGGREAGHGLIGMNERAALYGGRLEAGPRESGGFIVTARLPIDRSGG